MNAVCVPLLIWLSVLVSVAHSLNPLVIKGYKFFDVKTGENVGIKGVAYYPRPNSGKLNVNNKDFFTEEFASIWERDIPHLKAAGVNAIRIYAVDPTKNHDKFMCALNKAGIYAIIGLAASCKNCAISKDSPPLCYPKELKTRGQMIITQFAKYKNTLGFSAGNEVNHYVDSKKPELNAPCQKRFLRDMRIFIAKCKAFREIPVGVVLADSQNQRQLNAQYYNCRSNPKDKYENAQWYGINPYLYCNGRVTQLKDATGMQNLLKDFDALKYSIPTLVTEFGCLNPSFPTVGKYNAQRTFLQAGWLLSDAKFRNHFAGGFVFEYSTEIANAGKKNYPFLDYGAQNFGLGYFSPIDCDEKEIKCVYNRMPNHASLAKQYGSVSFEGEPLMKDFEPAADRVKPSVCPAQFPKLSSFTWESDTMKDLSCPVESSCFLCENDKDPTGCSSGSGSGSVDTGESNGGNIGEGSKGGNNGGSNGGKQDENSKGDSQAGNVNVAVDLFSWILPFFCCSFSMVILR